MGNSEVGHANIGAGRVVFQDLPRISNAIADESFFGNPAYLEAMSACKKSGSALHLMGLLSDGGVHSHISHVEALLEMAKRQGLRKVYVHAFLDGRDVSPTSGAGFVAKLGHFCETLGTGRIASVMGRYFAMDRDNRWERVHRAYDALTGEDSAPLETDPAAAISASYERGVTDEFLEPLRTCEGGRIQPGDSVIFWNFRPDRARELTRAFCQTDFSEFPRKTSYLHPAFVCTTEYDAGFTRVKVAFPPKCPANTLGEYLSELGLSQLRLAETEKYAHVTFFFNGGREEPFPGEERVLIPSPQVATYDLQPEMSAPDLAAEAVRRIEAGEQDVIIMNFANCDMVGHTGNYTAAVRAVEAVDACLGKVLAAAAKVGGLVLVTADHGNAEQMANADGSPMTAHTTNPVPFHIVGIGGKLRAGGRLADIAPTMLDLLGYEVPAEMDGRSLIIS
jgi:2,3-bisphosphoglycerate-independent phosphoglycerate mutase